MTDSSAADEMARLQSYDDLTAQIWHDKRATPGARELLLAMAWTLLRNPERPTGRDYWNAVGRLLGHDRIGRWRYREQIAEDAPRYNPPILQPGAARASVCEAPRLRPYKPRTQDTGVKCLFEHHPHLGECRPVTIYTDSAHQPRPAPQPSLTCGASGTLHLVERDPQTGWHIDHWFCARHREHYQRVKTQLAGAPAAPEPIPNTGGLIGCYFKCDLQRLYTQQLPDWKPPVYGLCADDWPTVDEAAARPRKAALRLIVGELTGA